MFYIKFIGLLLLVISGTGCGIYASLRLKNRAVFLEKYIGFLKDMEIRVRFGQCDVQELLNFQSTNSNLNSVLNICTKNLNSGQRFSEAWTLALKQARKQKMIDFREQKLLSDLSLFGTSDVDGELSKLQMHTERVTQSYQEILQECADKGKLYRTLGVFGGTALALIIM